MALGLTPKGKRDLRLRLAPEALTGAELSKPAEVRRLRIVAPEVAQSA
jgi:hypothetical protein